MTCNPVTMAELKAATFHFSMHMNLGDVHVSSYVCDEFPELVVISRVVKRRKASKNVRSGRFFSITGIDHEFDTPEEALEHLNAVRASAAEGRR